MVKGKKKGEGKRSFVSSIRHHTSSTGKLDRFLFPFTTRPHFTMDGGWGWILTKLGSIRHETSRQQYGSLVGTSGSGAQ